MYTHTDWVGEVHVCPEGELTPCPKTCKKKKFYMPTLMFGTGPKHIQNYYVQDQPHGSKLL